MQDINAHNKLEGDNLASSFIQYYSPEDGETERLVRAAVFGSDFGQRSWNEAEDLEAYYNRLGLTSDSTLMDLGCGYGGIALFMHRIGGACVVGYDINQTSIRASQELVQHCGAQDSISFHTTNLEDPLPRAGSSVDAVLINDVICHIERRFELLCECHRTLKQNGRILITDPLVLSGAISNFEVVARNMRAPYYYSPIGLNEKLLDRAGFKQIEVHDTTERLVTLAARWLDKRSKYESQLRSETSDQEYELTRRQLECVYQCAVEGRLSRILYVATRR